LKHFDQQLYIGIGLKLTGEIAGRFCQLGFIVLIARALGPSQFGVYSLAVFWGFLAGQLADSGLHLLINREEVRAKGTLAKVSLLVKIRLALILAPALVLVSFITVADPLQLLAFWTVAYSFVVYSFAEYGYSLLRAQGRLAQEAAITLTGRVLLLLCGLLGSWVGVGGLDWVALAHMLVSLMVAGLTLYLTYPLRSTPAFNAAESAWKVWKGALPLGLGLLLSLMAFRVDVVLLSIFRSQTELGNYSAAYRLFEPCLMLPAVFLTGWFPRLVRTAAFPTKFRAMSGQLLVLLGTLAVMIMVIYMLLAGPLVQWLYGSSYAAGAGLLELLALVIPIIYLNYALTHLLIAQGLEKYNTLFFGVVLVVNVGANLIAIPIWGGVGAALVTLLTEVVLLVLCTRKLFT